MGSRELTNLTSFLDAQPVGSALMIIDSNGRIEDCDYLKSAQKYFCALVTKINDENIVDPVPERIDNDGYTTIPQ